MLWVLCLWSRAGTGICLWSTPPRGDPSACPVQPVTIPAGCPVQSSWIPNPAPPAGSGEESSRSVGPVYYTIRGGPRRRRSPSTAHPAPRQPEAILVAFWSQREAGCNLCYTNQPSPHVNKTRPGCIDPAAARLVRLPCGGETEMMQRHSIVSWYSLGCRPGVRATSGHGSEIAPAGVHLRRVPRRARACMHGRLESFGSPWFDAVTNVLPPPRGVSRRAWLTASHLRGH